MEDLERWLLSELRKRNESPRSFSLAAGLDHGAVSRYLSGTQPARASCQKLAIYTGVPIEQVLIMAGHVKAPPDYDPFLEEVGDLAKEFGERDKEGALQLLRIYADRVRGQR